MGDDSSDQYSTLPEPAFGRSPFPPIADYAFLSDCEVNCLVAPSAWQWARDGNMPVPVVKTATAGSGRCAASSSTSCRAS